MKGEKGICVIGKAPNQIRRTQFDTSENAENVMNSLKEIGVVSMDFVIYKCFCGFWHFGKLEWKEEYGES
jgi:phosphoribosylaminoimidazole carboxylase (NCAIR synthetase)